MDVSALLVEMFGRVDEHVREAVEGLDADQLVTPPGAGANTVAWLVWHLARVQDHHVAELMGADQLWVNGEWAGRMGLEPDPDDTGYGHSADEVLGVRPDGPEVLIDYYDAVAERTRTYLGGLVAGDLDRVVDERWDPPVTLGVRLVSVADDDVQHAGQAVFVRGLLERATGG